jgi:hypothetical protein
MADTAEYSPATLRDIGAPERAARQCMPIDFYLKPGRK